jgi:hypothetical protein
MEQAGQEGQDGTIKVGRAEEGHDGREMYEEDGGGQPSANWEDFVQLDIGEQQDREAGGGGAYSMTEEEQEAAVSGMVNETGREGEDEDQGQEQAGRKEKQARELEEEIERIKRDPEQTKWLMQQVAEQQAGRRDYEEDFDINAAVLKTIQEKATWLSVAKRGVAKREGDEAGEAEGKGSKKGEGRTTGKGDSVGGNKGAGKEGSKGAGSKGKGRTGRGEVWHAVGPGRKTTTTHTPDEQETTQRVIKRRNVRMP